VALKDYSIRVNKPHEKIINSISPGYMDTDMIKSIPENILNKMIKGSSLKTLVSVEEVANTIFFSLGENACHITGINIVVDAGSTA
jgi:NAD(P)-dependent dehydrogenase (short-subunit alcohol dehydrogenase family)